MAKKKLDENWDNEEDSDWLYWDNEYNKEKQAFIDIQIDPPQ